MANLDTSINNIELKTNKTASSALPLNTWNARQYPDALSVKNLNNNFMNEIYPVGSLYKTTSYAFNPSNAGWSGTWSLVESGYITRHINSQVIHPGLSGSGQVSKTKVIGCYERNLFAGMYNKPEFQKTGFHTEITTTGYTLAYAITGQSASWSFWDLTSHTFLVSDNPVYKWKRIA